MQAQTCAPGQSELPNAGMTKRGLTSRDGLWLSIAVVLHAGLFLVPVSKEPSDERSPAPALTIELLYRPVAVQPFVQRQPVPEPEPVQPPEPETTTPPEPEPAPVTELAVEDEIPPTTEIAEEPHTAMSTAVLLQSAADRKWPLPPEDTGRQLGVFVPQDVPENWKPAITVEDNRFNGMTVPRQVQVVDRWLSPDGSYNVVVNTPNGDTLCGRGRAWDPMQPLVENVVMFSSCGGGGKRTFEWPDRYRNSADNNPIANSTTN